ncbi:magnesium chelatase subunit D family protein [Pedococcus sp. NPDC057267]|uniref:magnesium chelatase subunit D family protein n=1 Tax=Pedococcus sp. NPDC057267 TaxID=3346077 RepID=UPI003632442E
MPHYPFSAIVGADDMALALVLTTVAPDVGGVLVRGEKGTAKSTMVRALAEVLPAQRVVTGCRFGCDPRHPDPGCPDGPHPGDTPAHDRPARLVELPVGATEDRVIGSLDLSRALGAGETAFDPGLLAAAHRGILYVDEVNLLHDHLVDLLLDAAAMGRNTVERDGVSMSHAARIVLVGTMNPEEGELRPQLLDRFGLTVEVAASREPSERAEVVRRRLAFDADPDTFSGSYAAEQAVLRDRIRRAQEALPAVRLSEWALTTIATVCAGFDVDGMRADLVTARAARAHAAWDGRTEVTREDIRAAARLALPHRRRRNPFDAPGLDEDLLDALLGDEAPDDDPEPDGPPPRDTGDGPDDSQTQDPGRSDHAGPDSPTGATPGADPQVGDQSEPDAGAEEVPEPVPAPLPSATAVAEAHDPYRARRLQVRGTGQGEPGRRSRAITSWGRTVGASSGGEGRIHLPATIAAAAPHQGRRGRTGPLLLHAQDLRHRITQGREANLVLLVVDASGSMGARQRMAEVKTAVLSLLLDAYRGRDRVGVVTFRGDDASLALPPTSSVEAAARCLTDLPHGGRTPLAEGLRTAARVLELERIRDPRRRPLLVLVTDGRATSGADALARVRWVADRWRSMGVDAVVVDCEAGRFRMGLAADLARRMGAEHIPLGEVAAASLVALITERNAA